MGTYLEGLLPLPLRTRSRPGRSASASPGEGAEFARMTPTHQYWARPSSLRLSDEGLRLFLPESVFSKDEWEVTIQLTLHHDTTTPLLVPYALPAQPIIQPRANFAAPAAGIAFT